MYVLKNPNLYNLHLASLEEYCHHCTDDSRFEAFIFGIFCTPNIQVNVPLFLPMDVAQFNGGHGRYRICPL